MTEDIKAYDPPNCYDEGSCIPRNVKEEVE